MQIANFCKPINSQKRVISLVVIHVPLKWISKYMYSYGISITNHMINGINTNVDSAWLKAEDYS